MHFVKLVLVKGSTRAIAEAKCHLVSELVLEYEDDTLPVEQRERGDEF